MTSEKTGTDGVIEPVEQKLVALTPGGDDEVLAARTDTSEIYLPPYERRRGDGRARPSHQ